MKLTYATVPGAGLVHHVTTRGGQRFGVLVDGAKRRSLLVYAASDPDTPAQSIVMEPDEADQVAEILHSRPLLDRLAAVERRLTELDRPR